MSCAVATFGRVLDARSAAPDGEWRGKAHALARAGWLVGSVFPAPVVLRHVECVVMRANATVLATMREPDQLPSPGPAAPYCSGSRRSESASSAYERLTADAAGAPLAHWPRVRGR
jgi:hypothetical protein